MSEEKLYVDLGGQSNPVDKTFTPELLAYADKKHKQDFPEAEIVMD